MFFDSSETFSDKQTLLWYFPVNLTAAITQECCLQFKVTGWTPDCGRATGITHELTLANTSCTYHFKDKMPHLHLPSPLILTLECFILERH